MPRFQLGCSLRAVTDADGSAAGELSRLLAENARLERELSTEPMRELLDKYGIKGLPSYDRLYGLPRFALAGAISINVSRLAWM